MKTEKLLEEIVKSLVEKPDAVSVARTIDELGVLLTVKLDQTDAGLVIGRKGSTVNAIRALIKAVGYRQNARINVKIDVPSRITSRRPAPAKEELDLDKL